MVCPEADKTASGRQSIDRRNAIGRHWGQTPPGHIHPGAEAHGTSLPSRQGQHCLAVGADPLAVGDPAVTISQILCVRDVADFIDLGRANTEIHRGSSLTWLPDVPETRLPKERRFLTG